MKYTIMMETIAIMTILIVLMPMLAYSESTKIIIGKGNWSAIKHGDNDTEYEHKEVNKMAFFLIYKDGELKRGFFKFIDGSNWIAINTDKWTENGGMIMDNNGDMAMLVLEDGKGELHLHSEEHEEEYMFDYIIVKQMNL